MHPSLRIQNGATGLELVTSASTGKGEVLVHLPRHLQLTETCDDPPPELTALMGKVPKELWQARLALALLRQVLAHLVTLRKHTSAPAYVSIRQHTSAYVSIRQHTSAYVASVSTPATGAGRPFFLVWQ